MFSHHCIFDLQPLFDVSPSWDNRDLAKANNHAYTLSLLRAMVGDKIILNAAFLDRGRKPDFKNGQKPS